MSAGKVSTNAAEVNGVAASTGIGTADTGTQRVAVASDSSIAVSSVGGTVTVTGTVTANAGTGTLAVSGPLTDAQLRATAVPVSGTVTATASGTQDTNTKQVNGATVDVGTGAAGTGTQRVAVASDSSIAATVSGTVAATQSGTWTVQPGNTANTTAWKVDGSAVTQPVSGTVTANAGTGTLAVSAASLPLPSGAATLAEQQTQTTALQLIDDVVHSPNAAIAKVAAIGGQMDDTTTVVATEGNVSAVRITAQRALHTNLRNDAGTELGTAGAPLRTDPTGSTTQPVSGPLTDAQLRASTVPVSLASTTITGTVTVDTEMAAAAAAADGVANPTAGIVQSFPSLHSGASWDRQVSALGAQNSTGAGIAAAGIFGQNDDVGTAIVSENQYAPVRISSRRALLVEGVASGTAVNVDGSAVTQPVSGTVTANAGTNLNTSALALEAGGNLAAIAASASVLDDWDESDRAKVNPIVGQAGVQGASGVVTALTQRVVLATDVALPTGSNVIGALTANQSVNVAQFNGVTPLMGAGNGGTGSQRVNIASDQVVIPVGGDVAHNGVDSGNPVKLGMRAVNHGVAPTALAAADRTDWLANRDGIPFVLCGHMNTKTLRLASTAANTNLAIVAGVANTKIIVTRVSATCSNANTVNVQVRIGFAAATTPTTTGVLLSHPGLAPGSGIVEGNGAGILGISANADALLITSGAPTSGSMDVCVSYFQLLEA